MTHSESVQRAYHWALTTREDKRRVPCMSLWAATQVLNAIESQNTQEAKYAAISDLVRDWVREKREGLKGPVELLKGM